MKRLGLAALLFVSSGLMASETGDQWVAKMKKTRTQIKQQLSNVKFKPVVSKMLRGNMAPQKLVADVSGVKYLYLKAKGIPNNSYCHSTWGEPTLTTVDGKTVKLNALKPRYAKMGWGRLIKNKDVAGKPLQIGSQKMAFGLLAHADSILVYALDNRYKSFSTFVGVANSAGRRGSGNFTITVGALERVVAEMNAVKTAFPQYNALTDALGNDWVMGDSEKAEKALQAKLERMVHLKATTSGLSALVELQELRAGFKSASTKMAIFNKAAMMRAINDLSKTYPEKYADKDALYAAVKSADLKTITAGLNAFNKSSLAQANKLLKLQRNVLLRNPVLDFDKIIMIKRHASYLGLVANFQGNSQVRQRGLGDEIVTLEYKKENAPLESVFTPPNKETITDIELDFDASKMLFSMPSKKNTWQVNELVFGKKGYTQLTPEDGYGIHNYDSCYLPDGNIIYTSTAARIGVPCVDGSSHVANNFLLDRATGKSRQLCFDQEHNWDPVVMNDGKILYQRWEYTDQVHSNARLLFTMNPDGTSQQGFYGSNSYWPTSFFYARPIPNSPSKVVGIASGHHGVHRMGEMIILDAAKGTHEADGVVQRITDYGKKVEPIVADQMVNNSWPKFLHPYPLNDKYFLVAGQTSKHAKWSLYLVDVWDNMLLLKESDTFAFFEPLPLKARKRPPVIPSRVNMAKKTATVYLQNVYYGPGLKDIPKGTVKKLRVFSYDFANHGQGGFYGVIGFDGPWDIRRMLGEVPVYEDGSAMFEIPANTPVAIQPLDADGKALQIMRSWFTGMPGEFLSCSGCHEERSDAPAARSSIAASKAPSRITPWADQVTGFSFPHQVQPVLDQYCAGCHDGSTKVNGKVAFDLRGGKMIKNYDAQHSGNGRFTGTAGIFSTSYVNLFPYVRGSGEESPLKILTPMEFHADTTDLIQLLEKGHYNVKLDAAARRKLLTWIDLNTPYHGTRGSMNDDNYMAKEKIRAEMRLKYGGIKENQEYMPALPPKRDFIAPVKTPLPVEGSLKVAGWPMSKAQAVAKQQATSATTKTVDLGNGLKINLRRIPAGSFVMGSKTGERDEMPRSVVKVEKGYWIAEAEVTNEQFRALYPTHDSRREDRIGYQFGVLCYDCNKPKQPVTRVSWKEAMAFCKKLAEKTGQKVTLPTEAQWEYACRAGSSQPFSYGGLNTDFSKQANLADKSTEKFAQNPYSTEEKPGYYKNPSIYDAYIPADKRFDDGQKISTFVKSYHANPWGLYDMHGNMAEWTRSLYKPYPYIGNDGRNDINATGKRVVRGGSWRDRPKNATSSFRFVYRDYHKVFNVGFRIVIED